MGRSRKRSSDSSSSESSDGSSEGRYKSRTYRSSSRRQSRKRTAEKPLDGGKSKKSEATRITSEAIGERQLRTSQRGETSSRKRSLTPPLNRTSPASIPDQVSTSTMESRVERLEQLLEIVAKQGAQTENRRFSLMKSEFIPEFNPENENLSAAKWLEKINQLKAINNWDDITTIYYMQTRFAGMAQNWYHSLTTYPSSWTEWMALITKSFPDHVDYATVLRKMLGRIKEKNETMTNYYFSKMELMRTCQITGRNAVSCLIDGIVNVTIQNGARAGRYVTPESLYEEYLSTLRDDKFTEINHMYQGTSGRRNLKPEQPKFREQSQQRKSDVKNVYCYNCKSKGHFHSNCPKERVECTKCHLLGHEANKCVVRVRRRIEVPSTGESVNILQIPQIPKSNELNTCYFIDCVINGEPMRGYVDSGCGAVTIRQSDVHKLGLKCEPASAWLRGFAGGTVHVSFKVNVYLIVDLATANVEALVVPDSVQNVPVIVGQPFVNNDNILVVIHGTQVRLFNKNEPIMSHINELLPKKIKLFARETSIIPSHHIGHIAVFSDENVGEIYIDLQNRNIPGNFHIIPRCIINMSTCGLIPVLNSSDKDVCYEKGRVVARGFTCYEEVNSSLIPVMHTEVTKFKPFTFEDIKAQLNVNLDISINNNLLKLINEYRDCFATNITETGKTNVTKMSISLTDDLPVTYRPYRMAFTEREVVREVVNDLLENNIIRESNSPYSSPILLVKKKNGEPRMCIDYRALNRKTLKTNQPLPRIDDLLDSLKGNKYFTSLDLASGYHQIPIEEESISKTAFVTPDGHYEFLRMPFGLVNAPAIFQRTINQILGPLRFETALAYLDDVLIPSVSIQQGIERLKCVLTLFRDAGLTLKLNKCHFLLENINYLGHEISAEGIRPGLDKIKAVSDFPVPKNVHEVRRFLGLTSYFRKFIKGFSSIAKPISSLTKKDVAFVWNNEEQLAYEQLKTKLVQRPILALYNRDAETEVHCDASKIGLGGILFQKQEDHTLKPVQYFSRTTTKEEKIYHSYELETLAVVDTLKKFRIYLIGIKFKVVTDCNSLRHTLMKRDLVPRIARWWLTIQEFNFDIEYRSGTKMIHVDALSRSPLVEDVEMMNVNVTEDDWVLSAQLQDSNCKNLIDILSQESHNKDSKLVYKEYCLKDNRLYRKTPNGPKWVVPKTARRRILMYYHDSAGHLGVDKTVEAISSRYWFSSMRGYVKNYINSCLGCLYNKVPAGKKPGRLNPIEKLSIPMDTLHIDHLGPFVKSVKKNSYLLVVVDAFTKFVFLKAVPNTKTIFVNRYLEQIIEMFGVPRRLICDRGTAFTSKAFTEFCKDLGIKRVLCATATPRANGQVERMNRTILSSLMASTEDETRWDELIPSVKWGINSTVNSTTGKSPYEIFFGYRPRGAHDAYLTSEVTCDQRQDLEALRGNVSQVIRNKQRIQKSFYDKRHAPLTKFTVGQHVLVQTNKGSNDGQSRKLEPRYKGPFIVTKVLDNDRYVVDELPGSKRCRTAYTGICPSDKMKRFITIVSPGETSDDGDE